MAQQEAEVQTKERQCKKARYDPKLGINIDTKPPNNHCTNQYVEIPEHTFGTKCRLSPRKYAMNPPQKIPSQYRTFGAC